jgi:hypothetical protein
MMVNMRIHSPAMLAVAAGLLGFAAPAAAETAPPKPDLSGYWNLPYVPNIAVTLKNWPFCALAWTVVEETITLHPVQDFNQTHLARHRQRLPLLPASPALQVKADGPSLRPAIAPTSLPTARPVIWSRARSSSAGKCLRNVGSLIPPRIVAGSCGMLAGDIDGTVRWRPSANK